MTDDDAPVPFPASDRLIIVLEAYFAKHGRSTTPRPVPKPVGPGKSHRVKFKAGERQPERPRPFAYETKRGKR